MPYKADVGVGDHLDDDDDDECCQDGGITLSKQKGVTHSDLAPHLKDLNRAGYNVWRTQQQDCHDQGEDVNHADDHNDTDTESVDFRLGLDTHDKHHLSSTLSRAATLSSLHSPSSTSLAETPSSNLTHHETTFRHHFYLETFSLTTTPYETLHSPCLPPHLPFLHRDLLTAYQHLTLFTVHTWTNYDHIEALFYTDTRIRHTGQPRLLPSHLDPTIEIQRLRLIIGSAWRDFATIDLCVAPATAANSYSLQVVRHLAPIAASPPTQLSWTFRTIFLARALTFLHGYVLPAGQCGIRLADLWALTSVFRFEPDCAGMYFDDGGRRRYRGDWTMHGGGGA